MKYTIKIVLFILIRFERVTLLLGKTREVVRYANQLLQKLTHSPLNRP